MEELVKYFESLEARIAALEEAQQTNEAVIASLEAELEDLKSRPEAEPQVVEKVVEKIVEVEKPVEVIKEVVKEVVVEKPVVVAAPIAEEPQPEPVVEEPQPEPEPELFAEPEEEPAKEEEPVAPKAMLYGKPVDDIRLAISLGDRFLYQRELFGQNAELMQRTLNDLNGLSSFDAALDYITSHFNWDTESNTYQQFIVTLHRRFG